MALSSLNVGASAAAVYTAQKAILSILTLNRGDAVTIAALETFTKVCEVKNVTITGCTFNGKEEK